MKNSARCGLLPVGMTDTLPPFVDYEAGAVSVLMSVLQGGGYQRVSPPLLEYEETLLSEKYGDLSNQTFRVTDAVSGRIMGIRADMTPQIGRIAVTRLKGEPRPLRLAYAGSVVRMFPTQLNPARQILQVGAELIGADCAKADAEIILLAAEALEKLGVPHFVFDLNLPTMFPALCRAFGIDPEDREKMLLSLNQKDFSAVLAILENTNRKTRESKDLFASLFQAFGDCDRVLDILRPLSLPAEAAAECRRLTEVVSLLKKEKNTLPLTIDIFENRGFEYHCGIGFSVFSKQSEQELGRGGRYFAGIEGEPFEPAVGITLFLQDILPLLEKRDDRKRIYVPFDVSFKEAAELRAKGFVTVCGLKEGGREEAQRQNCDCIYTGGRIEPL
ncbi:MAG: ATP phosphoribosyltransferase regulatory subunit [Alphaproteobacteria bacterium]|nr:ATP phosphoribosyltransferase regulatory subunit [Alphaproteobacteria bacterium]